VDYSVSEIWAKGLAGRLQLVELFGKLIGLLISEIGFHAEGTTAK
jgi:hypothetical protein